MTFHEILDEAIEKAIVDEIANVVAQAVRQELAHHHEHIIAIARKAVTDMLKAAQ